MREKIFLGGILSACIALGVSYSIVTPLFESPDEVWHYAYVREIATRRGLPVMQASVEQAWAQEGTQAPLYYLLGAPLLAWMDARQLEELPAPNPFARIGEPRAATNDNRNAFFHTPDENFPWRATALAAHLLRFCSVALSALTVAFTFALARTVFPTPRALPLVAASFVATLPQFLFIGSSINNDNLATLLATVTLWQLAQAWQRGMTWRRAVQLGALVGAALLTKFNTLTLVPLTLLVIVLLALPRRAWRVAVTHAGVFLLVVALSAGWWYARNLALYGDLSGLSLIIQLIGERAAPMPLTRWFSAESEGLRLSTFGVFGWMNVLAAPAFYWFYDLLVLGGGVGLLLASARAAKNLSRHHVAPALLALWCGVTFAALVYYNRALPAAQGRLLFPALGAFAVLWARGIGALVPTRAQVLLGALQFGVAALTPGLFLAPAYTPTLARAVPPDAIRVDDATIVGARVPHTAPQPGDAFDVTIFSRVPDAAHARRALFVHVVNSADVIIAQRDSAIASGNWDALSFPTLVADTLRVQIPLTTFAPDDWRVVIGAYAVTTRERLNEPITLTRWAARENRARWQFDFDGRTTLWRAQLSAPRVARGDSVRVQLHWSAAPPAHRVFVHALGEADRIWAAADAALARELELGLRFAPETPPGIYPLELGVYPLGGDRLAVFDAHNQLLGDRLFIGTIRVVE